MTGMSDVDVCNLALANIGQTQFIEGLDPTSTDLATSVCGKFYEFERDALLRTFYWPFAIARARPASIDATTLELGVVPSDWTYAYAYPTDCLKLKGIFDGLRRSRVDQEIEYVIENDSKAGRIVLTDQVSPEFIYTRRITDPTLFAPDFVETLSWKLGIRLALGVRKDPELAKTAAGAYKAALAEAMANARNEQGPEPEPRPAHLAARS